MPCYMFTYHGYGTWMPDHERGYVHRTRGLQPTDAEMGDTYRRRQRESTVRLSPAVQSLLVEVARAAGDHLNATVHAVGTEPTHVHVLTSWRHDRPWKSMRASIRSALTRRLNERFERRTWFSDTPSRKRVRDRGHFDYLVLEYLPKHRGAVWVREEDRQRALRREG